MSKTLSETLDNPRLFRRLTLVAAVSTYLLIVVGGIVRVSGSGLGCPDWPLCYGRPIPPFETTALIEMSHRYVAAITVTLIAAVMALGWYRYRSVPAIRAAALAVCTLLLVQVPLGGLVVITELRMLLVNIHLAIALSVLAGMIVIAVAAHPAQASVLPARYLHLLQVALVALFVLLITGKVVIANNAQLACLDWPLCRGGLLPEPGASIRVWLHLIHRYVVAAVSILIGVVIAATFRHRSLATGSRRLAVALGALFLAQAGIGAVQVLLTLPPIWRGLHLAVGSAVWGVLVALAAINLLHRAPAPAELPVETAAITHRPSRPAAPLISSD